MKKTDGWQKVKDLLYEAIELPADKRLAFLEQACGDDTKLLEDLNVLLKAHVEAAGFMETPPSVVNDLPEIFDSLEDNVQGKIVGGFRLLRLLGQGGMGEVFLAERADGLFDHQVALKLLKIQESEAVLRRFEVERRILASLQHRNIAKLLDGGTTDDGRPYFAMEYVDGQPLTAYADAHNLTIKNRIDLIIAVGQAVQHAHRNLVVHRDLKPSNILVQENEDGGAQVKLLDFGIAKLLSKDDEHSALTESGARLMTRAYASPEQITGAPITTATDVYSLGAVLYELLTGKRLFDATSPHELEKAILEKQPVAPSVIVTRTASSDTDSSSIQNETGWAKKLRGDLDVVCLKAVRKKASERYTTMEAFVADLRRHQAGLPVEAQPPTRGYRLRKFVQRHRAGTIGALLLFVLSTLFVVAMIMQQAETTRQRDRAERALVESETVTDFLLDLFAANRPSEARGDTITARELLERGQDRLAALDDQPEVQAVMKLQIGRIYRNLGEYDKAVPLIEQSLEDRRQLYGEIHEEVATSIANLAMLRVQQGLFEEALKLSRQSMMMQEKLLPDDHPAILENLQTLASIHKHLGNFEESETRFEQLLDLSYSMEAPDSLDIASIHNAYGKLLDDMFEYETSHEQYKKALAIYNLYRDVDHPDIVYTRGNLGSALYRAKRYQEAAVQIEEVVALHRRVLGNEHPRLASSLNTLGAIFNANKEHDLAIKHFDEAAAIYKNALGEEHPSVATVIYNSARVSHKAEDLETAEAGYRRALRIRKAALGNKHTRVALIEMYLGRLLYEKQRYREAESLYLQALSTFEKELRKNNSSATIIRKWLVELYEVEGRPDDAARYAPS